MVAKIAPQIARLASRALVRVEGPDWRPFLHNLLTHDVERLEPGGLRFAALLTPQGRLLHDVFVLADDAAAVLDVQAGQREALIKRLTLYKLRAKVTVEPAEGAVSVAWGADPGAGWALDPRIPELGWRGLGAAAEPSVREDDYDLHRLRLGVPDSARDCSAATYPIEANFDLLNGIDFRKGCFIGQETTSRMHRRGTVKTRMLPITFDGPPPAFGAEVLARAATGELRAGEVLSGAPGRALALLRLDRIAGAELSVDGGKVRADPPPWMTRALAAAG